MRLNPWLNAVNHQREMDLLGYGGDADNTRNTILCLFEPDAPGLTAESFPREESVYFGSRPGKPYPFLPSMAEVPDAEAFQLVERWRADQTGGIPADPETIKRIVWEYKNVTDGRGLTKVMHGLIAKHRAREGAAAAPRLPVMPDLRQALNIAAADVRGVIVVVHPSGGAPAMEERMARLAFEEGIAGRSHLARLTAEEWAEARADGPIEGGSLEAGIIFVAPDPWGLTGEVWAEIVPEADEERTRAELVLVLDRFRRDWRKLDRVSHIRRGVENGVSWTEYDPDTGDIVLVSKGSKKLGLGKKH